VFAGRVELAAMTPRWPQLLAVARTKTGLTQTQLGRLVGTSGNQVSRWERGIQRPKDEQKVKLARVLGVPLADLFPWEDLTNDGEAA
jgi:transcriptional regulator with XRE-family HTH domain